MMYRAEITTNLYSHEINRDGLPNVVNVLKDWAYARQFEINWIGKGFYFGEIKVGDTIIGRFHIHPA